MSENIVCNEQKHRMQTATSLYATTTTSGHWHDKTPHSNMPDKATAGGKQKSAAIRNDGGTHISQTRMTREWMLRVLDRQQPKPYQPRCQ